MFIKAVYKMYTRLGIMVTRNATDGIFLKLNIKNTRGV